MTGQVEIDYDQLVADYWENLTTVLRGFNPAEECEFLETWVPDDDDVRSIINIIEAGKEAGLAELSLRISKDTMRSLETKRLSKLAANHGKVHVDVGKNGMVLVVHFMEVN